jgi:hypothetical protein
MSTSYVLHLLPNAHLDPVWLWDWREGMNEGTITTRTVQMFLRGKPVFGVAGLHPHSALYTGVNYLRKNPAGEHQCVSFYRFHVLDPIYFQNDIRVELQQLGAGGPAGGETAAEFFEKNGFKGPHIHPDVDNPGRMMSSWLYDRSDDYCSVAYWYQKPTGRALPPLPNREARIKGIGLPP